MASEHAVPPGCSPINGQPPPVETRWQPGQSANPGGWSKGASIRTALARRLARDPDADGLGAETNLVSDELVTAARAGDRDKVWSIAQLIAEVEGKPRERVEHSGATTRTIVVEKGATEPPAMPTETP